MNCPNECIVTNYKTSQQRNFEDHSSVMERHWLSSRFSLEIEIIVQNCCVLPADGVRDCRRERLRHVRRQTFPSTPRLRQRSPPVSTLFPRPDFCARTLSVRGLSPARVHSNRRMLTGATGKNLRRNKSRAVCREFE